MFENKEKTSLEELGEFGLIKHLTQNFKIKHDTSVKGVGDDAAVLECKDKQILISTDLLLEGIHFDLSYVPLVHLGYKAVQVNLSDIYAMNGLAQQITVSLGLSNKFPLEAVEEIYKGIEIACNKYNIDLIGGDISASKQGLVISVTSIGFAKKEDVTYRNGAEENDLLCVSGDLGGAYVGLQILEREKKIFFENPKIQPDLEGKDYIIERQLKPEARRDIIDLLYQLNIKPSSMIDISDGLASEILHLCQQSEKGCTVYEEKIPIDPMTWETAWKIGLDPTICALHGGEDYELLFTIKQVDYEKIKHDVDISIIGYMTDKNLGVNMISKSNAVHELKAQGWNAFKKTSIKSKQKG